MGGYSHGDHPNTKAAYHLTAPGMHAQWGYIGGNISKKYCEEWLYINGSLAYSELVCNDIF